MVVEAWHAHEGVECVGLYWPALTPKGEEAEDEYNEGMRSEKVEGAGETEGQEAAGDGAVADCTAGAAMVEANGHELGRDQAGLELSWKQNGEYSCKRGRGPCMLRVLQAVAACCGGPWLATMFRAMAFDFRHFNAGEGARR